MPNTLAHAGVQGVVSGTVWQDIDPKWIYVGCVIPDVPWILQRVVRTVVPQIDLYALRAYAIVQSSLIFSLVLCALIALAARNAYRVYAILGVNALIHLLLDACQTKWANGVHLFAPFSWDLVNFGLFWPESITAYALTVGGLVYILYYGPKSIRRPPDLVWGRPKYLAAMVLAGVVYFAAPLLLLDRPIDANNHFLNTLIQKEARTGKYVELDRVGYVRTGKGRALKVWSGESIPVGPIDVRPPALVSVKGVFANPDKLRVTAYHEHRSGFRAAGSYIGLALIALIWIAAAGRRRLLSAADGS